MSRTVMARLLAVHPISVAKMRTLIDQVFPRTPGGHIVPTGSPVTAERCSAEHIAEGGRLLPGPPRLAFGHDSED
jgi:hypothetical protein